MIRIRLMTAADIPLGMRLKEQNGWNQIEADWHRVLYLQAEGCFVAEWNGEPVGTTVTTIFGEIAWIAMVLVDQAHRGHGIGTALMKHALDFLDRRGVPSVRLDATPLGRPIYEKLGFSVEYELARYEGTLPREPPGAPTSPIVLKALLHGKRSEGVGGKILQFDQAVTHADRGRFLIELFKRFGKFVQIAWRNDTLAGYCAARPGSRATLIGPCVADPDAGPVLLADAVRRFAGQAVFIDVPLANADAKRFAERCGLTVQRPLLRMGRGRPALERLDCLWASAGPEKG